MSLDRLGRAIDEAWRERNYQHELFPELASRMLAADPVHQYLSPLDIARWTQQTPRFPNQVNLDARFGEPSMVVWTGSAHFYIEAIFWLDGTTGIHQHLFSGAFQLLSGSSIHTEFRFEAELELAAQLRHGRVEPIRSELLRVGDTRAIVGGHRFIHSLFHLDSPSVTIVVRTYSDVGAEPGFEYLRPGLARDPFHQPQRLVRMTQLHKVLAQTQDPAYVPIVAEALRDVDAASAFFLLEHCWYSAPNDRASLGLLLDHARERHGALVDLWSAALDERRRQLYIIERRRVVRDPLHRFFLALLLNVADRDALLALICQRFPDDDPISRALAWIRDISSLRVDGPVADNPLGFEFGDAELAVLEELMRGGGSDQEIVARLARVHDGVAGQEAEFAELCRGLRQSPLWSALCRPVGP
jgi:hypothetical protein